MKIFSYAFLCMCMALLFTACSDDELTSERIVGNWILQSLEVSDCDDSDENFLSSEADSNNCFIADAENEALFCDFRLIILNDQTATISFTDEEGDDESVAFTYTVDDSTGIITLCEDSSPDCDVAEFNGNTLVWTIEGDDGCVAVLELTN